ncbi:MAG: UDP-3-O-(3-hydroxymyristoyl)glucosamine N-acyltransferase [Saprospiraceae bacterium]|nr:UDP-3-O-(3-hydroxymyristoyl)glucosamine N-acyltransferase [Candidatus Vicinibacter affinis]MBK8402559.1 UDP-3-O-(3-hydroxymyristoyl)glucosamine N-acyltransferase [Candidatus Vicinibacter affinis]MBK8643035.1 UDP-3-O-(3-hydroxymyristoyl)glucosamine N-acyltransferase [Candidatus Vicinibacter affinis]
MKLAQPIPVKELAEKFSLKIIGEANQLVYGINEIHKVTPGDLTFVDAEKYYSKSINSPATIILINKETECPPGKTLLVCEQPFEVYNQLVISVRPEQALNTNYAHTADIHPTAIIEPGAIIGHHAVIGEGTYIQANAYIGEYTVIGKNCRIQAGAILGTDAFYYKKTKDGFVKWRSCGRTILHDHVEIGAGSTINKGVSGDTIIGEGTKIDCQVHIGHGVVVGKHCLFAAQVGIGGKTIIGDHVVLYGQVGVAQNLVIESNVTVLATSGVSKSLEAGKTYFGAPAEEISVKYRELAALRGLPKLIRGK